MSQIFIELYNYKPAWKALAVEDRHRVEAGVLGALASLEAAGLEVIGWGHNDAATDHRAAYDFFCVYRTPSAEFTRQFEQGIAQSGWHDLFEQVAVSGLARSPAEVLAGNVALTS